MYVFFKCPESDFDLKFDARYTGLKFIEPKGTRNTYPVAGGESLINEINVK